MVTEQRPLGAQSPFTRQLCASWLHAPGTVGQFASIVHAALVTVQWPLTSGHWVLLKQADEVDEHCPACVGHWVSFWQTLPTIVQWPSAGH